MLFMHEFTKQFVSSFFLQNFYAEMRRKELAIKRILTWLMERYNLIIKIKMVRGMGEGGWLHNLWHQTFC